MAGLTDHYGLTQLEGGESFSLDGYKYTSADRRTIDNLLYLGAEGHRHTGETGTIEEPDSPLSLVLNSTGGTLPAGTRIYYKYTLVNNRGEETIASPEAYVDTPLPIAEPGAPSLTYATTGGAMQGGNYFYVLTAFTGSSIAESKAQNPAFITVPPTTLTNVITLTLPTLPDGAEGFNVYRRMPGQAKYFYVDSVYMDVATPPTTYVDTGYPEDCDRGLPKSNTTNGTNSVDITLPGATPAAPFGYTWKIYRTYVPGAWSNSLLTHVVEYVSEATPTITPTYLDVGASTTSGTFPLSSMVVSSPSKIDLTDGAEVQGTLPMGSSAFPWVVSFEFPGGMSQLEGEIPWVCEYPRATIIGCRAFLGRGEDAGEGATPTEDVVVDVNKMTDGVNYNTIYTTQANRPTVPAGTQIGARTVPDDRLLEEGDVLTVDIDEPGATGVTRDRNLTVNVYMIVDGYPQVSFEFGTDTGVIP